MINLVVNQQLAADCNACCCAQIKHKLPPGTLEGVTIDYTSWSAGIPGHGLKDSLIELEKLGTPLGTAGNQPPVNVDYEFNVDTGVALIDNVNSGASDPELDPLTYAILAPYGARHGVLVFNTDGTFTYTSANGFIGCEEIYFTTTDGTSTIVNRLVILVNAAGGAPLPSKPAKGGVYIDTSRVKIDKPWHLVRFPLEITPAAAPGDVYRMTVHTSNLDCDGNCHLIKCCWDLTVSKC